MDDLSKKVSNYLEKYKVEDVLNKNSKILFILESPHTQEMNDGHPVAGDSGVEMTKFIYGSDFSDAFGKIVKNNEEYRGQYSNLDKFSILNVASAPMQKKGLVNYHLSSADNKVLSVLEKLRVNYKAKKHNNQDWNQVKEVLLNDFSKRLSNALDFISEVEYIVPCGKFASNYLRLIKEIIAQKEVIEGIPHPSFNQWRHYETMDRLSQVLEKI